MVAKEDTDEAYSAWQSRSLLIIGIVGGILVTALIVAGLVWQRRRKYYYWTLYAAEAERSRAEDRNRERLETLVHLSEMETAGEQELADFVLKAECRLMDSPLAFIGVLTPGETAFEITAWSDAAMTGFPRAEQPVNVPLEKAGIWAEGVRQRKSLIENNYSPYPDGVHDRSPVTVTRFASVPIFEDQRIVMVCTVANKETDYTAADVDNLTLLMQGVLNHLRKRAADDALRQKNTDLESAYEEITAGDEELRANYDEIARTQAALAESERKYRNLYQFAPVGLFETSLKDAKIVACNQRYCDLAGFPSIQEAIGKDVLRLYAFPEDRTEVSRILRELGAIVNYTLKFRHLATGAIFWAQFSARYNAERDVAEGSIVDITEQKLAEEKVKLSEARYRRLFESAKDGILILSYETGEIIDANPFIEILLGYSPDELIGKRLWDLGAFKDRFGSKAAFEELKAAEYLRYDDLPLRTKDGQVREVEFISNVYPFDHTSVIQCNIRDITDRKALELQREALIRELEQKNAELERFTYTVSHDLKSPLITIKGFAGLLEDDVIKGDPLQLKKDIGRILTAADTMQALLVDLLELSRVGKIVNLSETIPFGTIAREAVDLLAGPLAEKNVTVEIEPDLPEVFVDHTRIREVMVNLMENAIKFLGNRPDPKISIGVVIDGKTPVFFVRDNGIGVNPRYLDRIFNLFERLDANALGTGMGLTIARRIIEMHGGKVWAESEGAGKGTTFWFTLPVAGTR